MRLPRYWISRWGRDSTTVSMFTGRLFNYCLFVCLFSDVRALLSTKPFTNRQGIGYLHYNGKTISKCSCEWNKAKSWQLWNHITVQFCDTLIRMNCKEIQLNYHYSRNWPCPLHWDLHWLPVRRCVDYKLALLVYKSLHGLAPPYLADDCILASSDEFRRRLRSADVDTCIVHGHASSRGP